MAITDQITNTEFDAANILIIEDEEMLAELYGEWLSGYYHIQIATDGEQGLELLDESIDLVILDRRMPGKSGDEVLEDLRSQGFSCKVIMVTAVDPDLNILDMDFDDYLCKPIDRSTLLDTVHHHIVPGNRTVDLLDEFFGNVSKVMVLEDTKSRHELQDHDEYNRIRRRVSELGNELRDTVDDFDEMVRSYRDIKRS